jgi:pimeloyl-ACP methyl ester carboxylesterase
LFLWGDKDPLGTPDAGRALAEQIPNAQVRVVEDASHLVWLDQPESCAQAMFQFLAAGNAPSGVAARSDYRSTVRDPRP